MKAYICDRCGQVMKEKPRKVVITTPDSGGHQKQLEDGKELFAKDYCEKCSNEILDFLGNNKAAVVVNESKEPTKKRTKQLKSFSQLDVDMGKIGALHKAGWSIKSIADEMKEPEEVIERILRV